MKAIAVAYKTAIPKDVQAYIDIIEHEEQRSNKERKQLVAYIKKVFETETLIYDEQQIATYFSFQKFFPYSLFEWEKFIFVLHCCVFREDGEPRWPTLLMLMGRGGGKNGYLSFEDFCLLTPTNGIKTYDIDICATNEDQAKTSFMDIYNILEDPQNTKKLKRFFRWTKTEITNLKTNSTLKFRTNNAKGKDGLRSGKVDFDELHAYEDWDNINVFTTGLGKKAHPRRTYATTNGNVRDGPLDKLIEKSQKILTGEIPDNGFLPFICKLDAEEEVHDEKNWEKANPSYRYLKNLQTEIKNEYLEYLDDPVAHSEFMTKRMNIPKGHQDTEVTSWENILATKGELPDLTGMPCVCGIDYSKTTDFVAVVLLFRKEDHYYAVHHSWFCTACNDKGRIKFPLKEAEEKGLLTIVDEAEINPEIIAEYIREQRSKYDLRMIAIDNYRYAILSRALGGLGYSSKDKQLKMVRPSDLMLVQPKIHSWFATHKITWGDDMMMRWYTNNAKLVPAANNNYTYGKIEAKSRKTDGFMAFVAAATCEESLPEDFEVTFYAPLIF